MYEAHLNQSLETASRLRSLCSRISFWRLICCAAAAIFFYLGYTGREFFCCLLGGACALGFLMLVFWDLRLKQRLSYEEDCQAVIADYKARLTDGWKQFCEHGARYLAGKDAWAHDLDIFGKHSLYQYLCTASSVFGQDQLARWLSQPQDADTKDTLSGSVKSRQQAVLELAQKAGFTLSYEAAARRLRTHTYDASQKTLDDFFHSLHETDKPQADGLPAAGTVLIFAVPVLTVASLFLSLSGIERRFSPVCFFVLSTLQLFASFVCHWRNSRLLAPVYRMNQTAEPYRKLFALALQEPFESPYLQQLQRQLSKNDTARPLKKKNRSGAVYAFVKLRSICSAVVTRHNAYAYFLLNSLICYDFHCVRRYFLWKEAYRNDVRTWMQAAGCIEALISLGVIARTNKSCTMPAVTDSKKPELSVTGLTHPLLKQPGAVGNDFVMAHQTCMITGSNMSGKTTFLRSIGVNSILAYAGGFCTASSFRISRMAVCTSMRTADDINEGISTFYAELLHIQKIIETSRKQKPMLALIDEIYKGTNSTDRIFAARETVKKLAKPYVFTILTTHDRELCSIEQDAGMDAANFHFCEHYHEDQILFDYKIRHGICETANARYLLRMAGILEE